MGSREESRRGCSWIEPEHALNGLLMLTKKAQYAFVP